MLLAGVEELLKVAVEEQSNIDLVVVFDVVGGRDIVEVGFGAVAELDIVEVGFGAVAELDIVEVGVGA